jgi:hypothetical protein
MERYDVFDAETGDALVMYRIPYRPEEEKPQRPVTAPPAFDRRTRRAMAKKGGMVGHMMPVPPNASEATRVVIGHLLRLMGKHASDKTLKLPTPLAAEQRALALMTVAAHELSSMPSSSHKQAIVKQMGEFLGWLVAQSEDAPEMPNIAERDLGRLAAEGIAKEVDLGRDDTGEMH